MKRIAVDSEATGLHPFLGDRPFSIQTSDEDLKSGFWRVPVHRYDRTVEWGHEGPWSELENWKVAKVFHNAKYDLQMLESIGRTVKGRIDDTMIMAKVLFSEQKASLKDLGVQWLDIPKDDETALHEAVKAARDEAAEKGWAIADDSGRWGDKPYMADFWLPAVEKELERYARLDPERTMLLFHLLNPMLDEFGLREHYEAEMELLRVVLDMERRGVRCHRHVCKFENSKAKLKQKWHASELQQALKKLGFSADPKLVKKQGGMLLNVDSGNQVRSLVYDHLKFPIKRYTDKGNPSTDAVALGQMNHPIIKNIIGLKAQMKTQEFFNNYLLHSRTNAEGIDVLHPNFKQVGARTFRFSCMNPNLQNAPDAASSRGFEPIQARAPFGPRPGKIWLHKDWSQIEMWIFGGEANDPALLADMHTGSLHTATANRIYGKGRDIVAEEEAKGIKSSRHKAKTLNFGVVFCMGIDAMADALSCSRSEAKRNLAYYYDQYTRIRPFMDKIIGLAQRDGYIRNRYGWKLDVNPQLAYRAVNYIVQSSAAAHMKEKMLWLNQYYLDHPEIGAEIVLTIHDEIVTEVEESKIMPHLATIKAELENHHGKWSEFPKLPIEFKITRERWDKPEKLK